MRGRSHKGTFAGTSAPLKLPYVGMRNKESFAGSGEIWMKKDGKHLFPKPALAYAVLK